MILSVGARTSAVRYSFLLVCHNPYFSHNLSAPGNRGRKGTRSIVPYPMPLAPLPVIDRCDTLKPGTVRVHYTGQCLNCRLLSVSCHIHLAMSECYTTSLRYIEKFVHTNFFRHHGEKHMLLLSSMLVFLSCIFVCAALIFIYFPRNSHELNTVNIPDMIFCSFMFYILFSILVVFIFVCILAV